MATEVSAAPSGFGSRPDLRDRPTRPGAGIAPVKAEYILHSSTGGTLAGGAAAEGAADDDDAEASTNHATTELQEQEGGSRGVKRAREDADESGTATNPPAKGDSSSSRGKLSKEEKKARTGQNKGRRFKPVHDEIRLCSHVANGGTCPYGESKVDQQGASGQHSDGKRKQGPTQGCKMSHDVTSYLAGKEHDLPCLPSSSNGRLSDAPPFALPPRAGPENGVETPETGSSAPPSSVDLTTRCAAFNLTGSCPQGWKCRFLGAHIERADAGSESQGASNIVNGWRLVLARNAAEKTTIVSAAAAADDSASGHVADEVNFPPTAELRKLQTRTFPYPRSAEYLREVDPGCVAGLWNVEKAKAREERQSGNGQQVEASKVPAAVDELDEEAMMNAEPAVTDVHDGGVLANASGAGVDGDDIPTRPEEKRRLDWRGKTYLAPLTTVGNLPFRRLCVEYGADITCGEMALAQSIVQGGREEWALTRRHASERQFGVQLCGGRPSLMVPAAEAVAKLVGNGVDFVDVNLGCPIDLVFQKGAGSALFESPGKLGKILVGMNRVLGEIPLTVKFRTGIKSGVNTAHKFVPRFATEWGARAMTLHGRSRQQRYSKLADWSYIRECAGVLRDSCTDAGLPAPPIFGNGDCFSAQSYYEELEGSGVDGIMVARGALIKPWIFTEIQERREWDISAVERLDGIRKYAEYGLTHWGTDTKGINTTRRFLCEALSFQHRYIPIGLLERMPPLMNERPPAYRGRNELETLLASGDSQDWVKISEIFLGKSPEDFVFNPKHKSNSYGTEENQG